MALAQKQTKRGPALSAGRRAQSMRRRHTQVKINRSLAPSKNSDGGMFDPDGFCLPNILLPCANIKRAILIGVCQYLRMALQMPTSLKSGDPGATLHADGQEPFVAWAEPVRMSNVAEATTRIDPAPSHLAVDIRNVSLTFETADGKVDALSNVSLQVDSGEFVSFIGPSGCGKTTMLRVIADLQQPTAGSLLVNGMSAEQARLGRSYGYVFQAPALFPWRTIEKNLKLPLEIMGFSESEQKLRAERYLALVNLTGFERKFPWQLSGGMQQRVSIARALSFDPKLLLMDEPFGALDEIVRDHLNEQLLQLWDKTGKTVLFVTHSIPEAVFLSTRIVVMSPRPGRITDIIDCNFPRDRTLEIRETPEFLRIAQRVRVGLRAGHSYDE
jgi:NitT/TauT family transport system ATP-binding protein